jgi:hypothetical protein
MENIQVTKINQLCNGAVLPAAVDSNYYSTVVKGTGKA